jgi:hypothetical protein
MQAFPPRKIGTSFSFQHHPPTQGMVFSGPVVLSDDGLMLIPMSKQSQQAAGLLHFIGIIGLLVLLFMRSVKKISFPFPVLTYASVAPALADIPKLGKLKPDQPLMVVHKDLIRGFHSTFFGGLRLVCVNRVVIRLSGARNRNTLLMREIGLTDLAAV